jgi:poly-gamma-glutamate capsule biosynthesis protein CapA/YwtB (metallophosphatase superfamily)
VPVLVLCAVSLAAGYAAHGIVRHARHAHHAVQAPPHGAKKTASTKTAATRRAKAPPPVRRAITITAVGDTMLGSTPTLPPSPATYFSAVSSELHGDIVFGNLEGTLTDATSGKCRPKALGRTCFEFRAPPAFASDLRRAGFTIMNDANNHSYDFGPAGQADTVAALHAAGIAQTGLPGEITIVHARGLRVAVLGFAPYSDTASLLDLAAARALIERAGSMAKIVVVAIHAGAEGTGAMHVTGREETYVGEDRGNAEAFAHMAVDAGADLVLGSGPHVLRGMEIYHGRLIAYSLGNFAGYHNFTLEGALADSAILHVRLTAKGAFRSGRVVSVRLVDAGMPELDPSGAGAQLVGELSDDDLGSGAVAIGPRGRFTRIR